MIPVIVGSCRTPFTRFGGPLRDATLPQLGSHAVAGALARAGLVTADVGEVVIGVNLPGSDRSIARQVALEAGFPASTNAMTVDRACCSSLAALGVATRSLAAGEYDCAVVGGAENLSRVPFFLEDLRWGHRLGDVTLSDQLVISCPLTGLPRAVQASAEAKLHGVDRRQQDEWAERSQRLYAQAREHGYPDVEILPIESERGLIESDVGPRPGTTIEELSLLPTVNGSETVTAGNAPGLSTGASALAVMTDVAARARELPVLAEVVAVVETSGPPNHIASAPAYAAMRALNRAGLRLRDVDVIEINEAFAAVPLVSTLVLEDGDATRASRLQERVNTDGGAIAIGHPTGATAARLVMTATERLRRRGGGTGLVTICGGIGEAAAAIIRVTGTTQ